MRIDVTIATKNSGKTIAKCIHHIKSFVPYNRIIVIDDSQDETPKIASRLGCEVHHLHSLLGEVRLKQAELAETPWIASIDSDVFVYPNWWKEVSQFIKQPNVGAISGYQDSSLANVFPDFDKFTKYRTMQLRKFVGIGSGGNTLMRRELLLQCSELSKRVHGGEDAVIGRFMRKKGYRWITIEKPISFHFHEDPIVHMRNEYRWIGVSKRIRFGLILGIFQVLKTPIMETFFWLKYAKEKRSFNFSIWFYLIHFSLVQLIGFLD
jgi:glycosyltransferase involved in cell wall biosynthesis